MSNYIESQFFSVLPEPILKGTNLDLKIKVSGLFGSTNWLNISQSDCEAIKAIIQKSYIERA